MNRKFHPFPDVDGFGQDDDLVTRKDLAKLLGVQEFTLRNWENAGLLPERAAAPEEGILINSPRVFWRVSELRAWVPRMVGVVFARPSRPKGTRKLEWIAGRGWVEKAPVSVPPVTPVAPSPKPPSRRSAKVPGRHLVQLTRLEAQLARLDRLEELEADLWQTEQTEVFQPEEQLPRRRVYRAEPEPEPFASNVVKRSRPARYWGS
jgi:hypothetical protein